MPGKFPGLVALVVVLGGCPQPQPVVPPSCGPANCAGCCDAMNVCQLGLSTSACGVNGNACDVCVGAQVCGDVCTWPDAGAPLDAGTDAGVDAGPTLRTVTGGRIFTLITDTGPRQAAGNLALVGFKTHSDVDGGAFVTVVGTGHADGGFEVRGVPNGPYCLSYRDDLLILTNEDVVDLASVTMGRAPVTVATSPTLLTINATGLIGWIANNTIAMTSTNLGFTLESLVAAGATPPTVGTTAATLTFDYGQGAAHGLVEAAQGDSVILTQNQLLAGPANYLAAMRSATITGLTQSNGLTSSVNAAFTALTLTDLTLDWRVSQFEPFRPAVHPGATVAGHKLSIYGVAGQTASTGVEGKTQPLLAMTKVGSSADLAGVVHFGNPFNNQVALNASYATLFAVPVQAPGAAAQTFLAGLTRAGRLSALSGPVLPALGPPRDLAINGVAVSGAVTGAGTTPVISWMPPALGTPDRYTIAIFRLTNAAGQTQITQVGTVRLKGTRARIPPGLLTAGETYAVMVTAGIVGVDVERTPFLVGPGVVELADAMIPSLTP